MYNCEQCQYQTVDKSNFNKHVKKHKYTETCRHCTRKFETKDAKDECEKSHPLLKCSECDFTSKSQRYMTQHKKSHIRKRKQNNDESKIPIKRVKKKKIPPLVPNQRGAMSKIVFEKNYRPKLKGLLIDIMKFYKKEFKNDLLDCLERFGQINFSTNFTIKFYKYKDDEIIYSDPSFQSNKQLNLKPGDVDEKLDLNMQEISRRVEEFHELESGFVYLETLNIALKVSKFKPHRAGGYIETPADIQKKKAIRNIKNNDNLCFVYCIVAALINLEVDDETNPEYYKPHFDKLDVEGIEMPPSFEDIRKIEKKNKLCINIYGLNAENEVIILQISEQQNMTPINLLVLEDGEKSHFTLITRLNALLCTDGLTRQVCPFCLHGFKYAKKLEEHIEYCRKKDPVRTVFPKDLNIEFKEIRNMVRPPFTIYCDFECIIVKDKRRQGDKSEIKSVHKPCGFCIVTTSPYFERNEICYRGEDADVKFVDALLNERNRLLKLINENSHEEMEPTAEEKKAWHEAKECWICEEEFLDSANVQKMLDATKHLNTMRPFLSECEMDIGKIPSMTEVKQQRKKILLHLHPDKAEQNNLDEETKLEREEEVKKKIAGFQWLRNYLLEHKLDADTDIDKWVEEIRNYLLKHKLDVDIDKWMEDEKEISAYILTIKKSFEKVMDHDHFDGSYRGAAHSKCNILFRVKRKHARIPVFFHNLANYDSHIVVDGWNKYNEQNDENVPIEVLAKTFEKFFQIKLGKHLQLRDSFCFLSYSLDKLVKYRKTIPNTSLPELFPNTYDFFKKNYPNLPDTAFKLLTRKGVYPYSYMDSFDKFYEEKLPPIEAYKNDLTGEDLTEEEYQFAQELWKILGLKNLAELHDLYLSTDTNLLADVFNGHRDMAYKEYQLDPANYVTAPSLSWSAALKKSKVKLQLIDDVDMSLFVDECLTGGYAAVVEHYAKANNPYLKEYDPEKPNSYILNTDCTNQYGACMKMHLPTGGFKWVEDTSIFTEEFIKKLESDQAIGYFIQADLEYPDYLHEAHNSFPLGPEKFKINKDLLSDYQRKLTEKLGLKAGGTKVCLTLNDKNKYSCHYLQLKQMIEMGMKLKKVHKVMQFNQSNWLESYIDLNTENRRKAQKLGDKCLELFYKLMNNSFFGKTCEDVRKYRQIHLEKDPEKALKKISKYTFKNFKLYGENLLALEMAKEKVELNKPRYIGNILVLIISILSFIIRGNNPESSKDYHV